MAAARCLGDLHDNTFPMLRGHPALLAPIGHSPVEYIERMQIIRGLKDQRQAQYAALHAGASIPTIWTNTTPRSSPHSACRASSRSLTNFRRPAIRTMAAKGELAHLAFQMATEVRKFGINLIFTGQSINADLVGPMRDQITTRVCFRVARRRSAARWCSGRARS